ncbi:MAG: META domain-containing protein [Candidatus Limnocylindrales bacterium]
MKVVRPLVAVVLAVSIAVLAAACSSGPQGGAIEARDWQVRAYADSSGRMQDAFLTVPLYARFENGSVAGTAGCSQFTASYAISGTRLSITGLQVGTETCDSYATQGRDTYMGALPLADSYQVDGTDLTIFDAEGHQVLRLKEKP